MEREKFWIVVDLHRNVTTEGRYESAAEAAGLADRMAQSSACGAEYGVAHVVKLVTVPAPTVVDLIDPVPF